jgi:hypothetical protein
LTGGKFSGKLWGDLGVSLLFASKLTMTADIFNQIGGGAYKIMKIHHFKSQSSQVLIQISWIPLQHTIFIPDKMEIIVLFIALMGVVSAQAPPYGQCGGEGWTGPTTCTAGMSLSKRSVLLALTSTRLDLCCLKSMVLSMCPGWQWISRSVSPITIISS